MKNLKLLSLAGIFIVLISCNNPLDKKYNEKTFPDDLKSILESKKADSTDLQYIAMYLVRAKMLGETIDGKTYDELLKNAKNIRAEEEKKIAEEKVLAEKLRREEEEKVMRFNKALTLTVYDKGFMEGDYQNYITYKFAFRNNTDKTIRAIKGSVVFNDLFDVEIKSLNITYDTRINPHSTNKESMTSDYNQFMDEDIRLKSKDIGDLKVVWKPEKIMFDDGTTLE